MYRLASLGNPWGLCKFSIFVVCGGHRLPDSAGTKGTPQISVCTKRRDATSGWSIPVGASICESVVSLCEEKDTFPNPCQSTCGLDVHPGWPLHQRTSGQLCACVGDMLKIQALRTLPRGTERQSFQVKLFEKFQNI